jgi:hypothetical protein
MALVEKKAALMVRDQEAKEKLIEKTIALLTDQNLKASLIKNIASLGHPNAAHEIALEVLKTANKEALESTQTQNNFSPNQNKKIEASSPISENRLFDRHWRNRHECTSSMVQSHGLRSSRL